jgi:hypothetical protein
MSREVKPLARPGIPEPPAAVDHREFTGRLPGGDEGCVHERPGQHWRKGKVPPMKLYICWGTFGSPRPGGHPCKNALEALKDAGHDPELVKVYGLGVLPDALNTSGRKEVAELTGGSSWVPVLVTDGGEVIQDSKKIEAWAKENPARASAA